MIIPLLLIGGRFCTDFLERIRDLVGDDSLKPAAIWSDSRVWHLLGAVFTGEDSTARVVVSRGTEHAQYELCMC